MCQSALADSKLRTRLRSGFPIAQDVSSMKSIGALRDRLRMSWPVASLRTYLVAVILLATVPLAALLSWQLYGDLEARRQLMGDNLRARAASLARSVERELASSIDALVSLSYADSIQVGDVLAFERSLTQNPRLRPTWSSAFLVDASGTRLFDTAELPAAQPLGAQQLQQLVAEGRPLVSDLSTLHGAYTTVIAVPVRVNGAPRYVLGARIDAAYWQNVVERAAPPAEGLLSIFDTERRIVARTLDPERSVGQPLPAAALGAMSGASSGLTRAERLEGGALYVAWDVVPLSGWGVGAGLRAEPLDAAHMRQIVAALITAAGCLLVGVVLALLVAHRLTDPLARLAQEGPAEREEPIRVREIAQLNEALLTARVHDQVARERLQAQADEFRTLFDHMPIGLAFAQDAKSRVVLHNAAMNALFGADVGTVTVLADGRPLPRDEQPLERAAAHGESVTALELELVIEGRPPAFVLASAVPLRDASGAPRGAIGAVVDITERKHAEARLYAFDRRLRESQRLVDLAQEAGHVGFLHYQFETDALAWTPGLAKLFGLDTQPVHSSLGDWVARIDDEDRARVQAQLRSVVDERRDTETIDFCVSRPDGSSHWLSCRLLVSYAEDGKPLRMVGVTVDLSDQKRAERARAALIEREQTARLEAEAANRAKDEFLAMLGHELRNPLSAIASAVEVLNRVDAGAQIAINAREIIARQTRHLARMMDDLLDVTRVIAGKVLLSLAPVELSQLARRVVSTLDLTGETDRHTLSIDVVPVWVDVDATRVEQVVNNLLTNALKYTPEGGEIALRLRRDGAEALLEVQDNGAGISKALLPRIFDLFVQSERTLDRRAGGLGIGLTLVRRLVELHGGKIGATSDGPGLGSVFALRLPAIEAPAAAAAHPRIPESRRRRVGVIEDNEDAMAALVAMLELDGHSVWTASDGNGGLDRLLQKRPDVAVVDIGLPGLDGYEVARRSRAAGYAGRLVALSGYGQASDVKRALVNGFDAHFSKPIDGDKLHRMLYDD